MNALPSEAAPSTPATSWRARLALGFEALDGRTRLTHREHHGPLLVQRAFYPESIQVRGHDSDAARADMATEPAGMAAEPCHVYLLHPPGGVVSGDELQIEARVRPRAHVLLTTPAATKFYRRRGERVARLSQALDVEDGVLEWLPQENIYYPHSVAEVRTIVRLSGAARFFGWEIGCFGLPANALDLGDGQVRQHLELWHEDAPVLLERVAVGPAVLRARWGLAGYAVSGTLLMYPAETGHLALARSCVGARTVVDQRGAVDERTVTGDVALACTLVDNALCCRGFAARADRLKQAFIDVWSALRPGLTGRRASPPRIWLT